MYVCMNVWKSSLNTLLSYEGKSSEGAGPGPEQGLEVSLGTVAAGLQLIQKIVPSVLTAGTGSGPGTAAGGGVM